MNRYINTSVRRLLGISVVLGYASLSMAQSCYDEGKPFGFVTQNSRTSALRKYTPTGGGAYEYPVPSTVTKVVVLTSTGKDMASAISSAIKNNSVIVFDGSKGDFIIAKTISLSSLNNKTLLGINGARLCTTWSASQEIRDALTKAGVPGMSTTSGGGTLPNGTKVTEEAEYQTRKIIMEITGDTKEAYRQSGIFSMSKCENIIIRNLKFVGPGSIDVSGHDLLSFTGSKHCWVDHCEFTDGMDGNFDITKSSDFNTVSWCTFSYTTRSYMHQNTNLVGSSDSEPTGYLNTTFAYNIWGEKCRARMPMARAGLIHMLNNYYCCAGNGTACINPRKNSEFLIKGNYFASGVKSIFSQSGSVAWTWKSSNSIHNGASAPSSNGTVTVPYEYSVFDAELLPSVVGEYAGATIFGNKQPESTLTGDADNDGKVTARDYNIVINYSLGKQVEINRKNADVNNDNAITLEDARLIVEIYTQRR